MSVIEELKERLLKEVPDKIHHILCCYGYDHARCNAVEELSGMLRNEIEELEAREVKE